MRTDIRWRFHAIFVVLVLNGCTEIEPPAAGDHHAGPAMNYHVIDQRLATSGHFIVDGLDDLAADGLRVIIDLRDSPPAGQQQKLGGRGIEWISIPVDWENPEVADFENFKKAMDRHATDKVLVQCAANYRASAMTYLYRVLVDKVPEQQALIDLQAVWHPNDVWTAYFSQVKSIGDF